MGIYTSFKDHLLIAMPALVDPTFFKSVIYICEHNENGAMGIVINQPTYIYLQEILDQINMNIQNLMVDNQIIFNGGPVDEGHLFVLHKPLGNWKSSLKITHDTGITTSMDIIKAIIDNQGPEQYLITLGYAGWGPGQIEQEMAQNSWVHTPACSEILFNIPAEKRWGIALEMLGIQYEQLSNQVGHA